MYGSYTALDRDINYLMHYNVKGSHWYHIGEGKRQEDPKKYAKGAATIGFDPSLYEKSKLWNKLKGKQNELKEKSNKAKSDSEAYKSLSDVYKKNSEELSKQLKRQEKENNYWFDARKWFDPTFKPELEKATRDLEKGIDDSNKLSSKMDSLSKKRKSDAFKYGVTSDLMNIPLRAVEFGIRTKEKINGAIKAIGNIKIGKHTIAQRARKLANFIMPKISKSYRQKLEDQRNAVNEYITKENEKKAAKETVDNWIRKKDAKQKVSKWIKNKYKLEPAYRTAKEYEASKRKVKNYTSNYNKNKEENKKKEEEKYKNIYDKYANNPPPSNDILRKLSLSIW